MRVHQIHPALPFGEDESVERRNPPIHTRRPVSTLGAGLLSIASTTLT